MSAVVPLLVLAALTAKNIVRSRPGRAFQAIRDREIAAAIIGVDRARYKVAAFAVSSFYAAAAGASLMSDLTSTVRSSRSSVERATRQRPVAWTSNVDSWRRSTSSSVLRDAPA